MPTIGGNEAKLPPTIPNGDLEESVVEGEEIRVTDLDGDRHGDVKGDDWGSVDVDMVETEVNDAEVGIGRPD